MCTRFILLFFFLFSFVIPSKAQNAGIALVKTGIITDINGNGCIDANDQVNYTFTVTNQGILDLTLVEVKDPLISPIVYDMGDLNSNMILEVSETWIYSATYILQPNDILNGSIVNQATATANSPEGIVTDFSDDNSIFEDDPTVLTFISCVLGNGDLTSMRGVKLSSNPVVDDLLLEIPDNIKQGLITIFDISGKQMIQSEIRSRSPKISVSWLPSGLYLVELQTGEKKSILRFVKK